MQGEMLLTTFFCCVQENVDAFMKKAENDSAETVLKRQEELHNKFKFMEYNMNMKKAR